MMEIQVLCFFLTNKSLLSKGPFNLTSFNRHWELSNEETRIDFLKPTPLHHELVYKYLAVVVPKMNNVLLQVQHGVFKGQAGAS